MQYTDEESGITVTILSTLYTDWGVSITDRDGQRMAYNPHGLCSESYGFHREDEDGNELEEGIDWSEEDWELSFAAGLFEELVDAYVGWENIGDSGKLEAEER